MRQSSRWQRLLYIAGLVATLSCGAQIPATHKQGSTHGFLVVKSAEGKVIGIGDQIQEMKGNQVRSRLVLHFRDGSVDDEVTVFTQASTFQLLSDHHVQKGPSFPDPLDLAIDIPGHKATWFEGKGEKRQRKTADLELPANVANGMISLAVQNFPANSSELELSYVAGASKPRIVKLIVTPDGYETFSLGGIERRSRRFNMHVEIGGVTGVVAKVIGKQPDDIKVWTLEGNSPVFLRMRGPLYQGGPIWTTELASPVWEHDNSQRGKQDRSK